MYLKALAAGGPVTSSGSSGFHEGIIFAEQHAAYGSTGSPYAYWINRANWPTATLVTGRPISGTGAGSYVPAFVSLYPLLLVDDYRASTSWRSRCRGS